MRASPCLLGGYTMTASYQLIMKFEKNTKVEERSFTCSTQRQADERQLNELIAYEQQGYRCVEAHLTRSRSRTT